METMHAFARLRARPRLDLVRSGIAKSSSVGDKILQSMGQAAGVAHPVAAAAAGLLDDSLMGSAPPSVSRRVLVFRRGLGG